MKISPLLQAVLVALLMVSPLPAELAGRPHKIVSLNQIPAGLAASDWQSIGAAYEAERHAFRPGEDGWQASNPGQQWITKFDGRGFVTHPSDNSWEWGLELKSYGFPGLERDITGPPVVEASGPRLFYQWDETVQEWWVNDSRGLAACRA